MMFPRRVNRSMILLLGAGMWMQASAGPAPPAKVASATSAAMPAESSTTSSPLATLQKRASTGDAAAEYALAYRLIESKNPIDRSKAVALYRKAAAQGNSDAEWALGFAYAVGDPSAGITQDVPTGLKWMRKSLSDGSADHMGLYGYMLAVSSFHAGNKQDMQDGVKWLRRGANGGSAQSMETLGGILWAGQLGVTRDTANAERWLLKSAKLGDAMAQESLGILYVVGGFGKSDVTAGLHWLRASAKQGDVTAEGELAALLITGGPGKTQISRDPQEGVQWATKAVARYNAVGFYALGNAYQYGEGEPKDLAKAWYNFAVAQRLDTSHQLEHVNQHLSEVAAKLSAAQLRQLKAEASKISLPKKNHQT